METRRKKLAVYGLDALLFVVSALHIFIAPYTKVEESFNTQAMHDILYHQNHLQKYDHFEFPGVVPRTFIGAIVVSLLASPFVTLIKFFGLSKLYSLYTVRLALASITVGSIHLMRRAIAHEFGSQVSKAFAIVTSVQFHLLFYCSRPLPNVFALACVTLAYYFWIRGKPRETLIMLVFGMVIFRCDIILLLAPIGLSVLMVRSVTFVDALWCCASTAIVSAALTFTVDSMMWRRWLWPEWEVFWFNTVLNRSSEWGVSPFHWYFSSALPRAMLAAYPLAILALAVEKRILKFVLPIFGFIILYSKLAHKELRFILFAVPMLNLAAATSIARIYNNRHKRVWGMVYKGCLLLFAASLCYTLLSTAASYRNYPGGQALSLLHNLDDLGQDVHKSVHIDVLPAMTGVSRFCERGQPWSYSKEEGLTPSEMCARNFTYLLSEQKTIPGYKCLFEVEGFSRVEFRLPLLRLISEPKVFIHASRNVTSLTQ